MKVQKGTYVTHVKKGLSFPAFDSKKSKPIGRFKDIVGWINLVTTVEDGA
jgi:hypothetical protein